MGDKRERMTDDSNQDRLDIRPDERLSVKDITHQPIWLRWTLYVIALAIIITGLYIVGRIMPFEPLTVEDVIVDPKESCGGYEATVRYVGRVEGGLYTLDNIEGFAFWTADNDPRPYSSIYFQVEDVEPFETMEFEGPTRRTAPWPVDTWHAGIDAKLYGKRFGFVPVIQHIEVRSDETLRTLDRHSSECDGEQRDN